MRCWVIICCILGVLHGMAVGQEDEIAAELVLWFESKGPDEMDAEEGRRWARIREEFRPQVKVWKGADGRIRVEQELAIEHHSVSGVHLRSLVSWIEGEMKKNPERLVFGRLSFTGIPGLRRIRSEIVCSPAESRLLLRIIRERESSLKQLRTTIVALEGDEVPVSFGDYEITSWSLTLWMGELDLGPMGKHYAHTWVRKDRERYYRSGNSLLLYSVESRLSGDLVEALGRVPKVLAQGKIFRWKSGGDSILAFPENRAILVRSPGAFRDENLQEIGELRVEFDDARRVERLLERRDRVEERLEKEWQPQLEALVKEGDPAIFALW